MIEKRLEHGPASPNRDQIKPPTSSYSLVRTYQREVERQRKMVLKAEHAHQRLLLVVQGWKKLFADEHFVNLLRAEGLDTLPKYLTEMYPGIYQPGHGDDGHDVPNLPTAPPSMSLWALNWRPTRCRLSSCCQARGCATGS